MHLATFFALLQQKHFFSACPRSIVYHFRDVQSGHSAISCVWDSTWLLAREHLSEHLATLDGAAARPSVGGQAREAETTETVRL